MKHNLRYMCASVLLGAVFISSCSKKIDEAYANPNALVRQPIEQIFPSLIGSITGSSSAAGSAYGLAGDALLIGRYIQFWGTFSTSASPASTTLANSTNYDQMGGTIAASDNLGSMWAAHYFGMGQNLNRIVEWGSEEQKWDFVGAAIALRAWSLYETANEYGEIILRQAFNTSLQQFTYEQQSESYDSVRATCHRALNYLNATGGNMNPTTFAASDFYFNGGSLDKWRKFTYGILARSFSLLTNKVSYNADSVIFYANLSCASNADNITCKFQNTGITGTSNYFGWVRQNVNSATSGIRQSAFIATLMNGANTGAFTGAPDPRRPYMLREDSNILFYGGPLTYHGITPWSGASGLAVRDQPFNFMGTGFGTTGYPSAQNGRYVFRDEAEWPVMTASEMQFILAEAYLRKANKPAGLIAYVNGINLNFDMLISKYSTNVPAAYVITPGSRAAYLASANVIPATAAGLTLTKILLQKYIATYAWGVHVTWADMRRFHYTDLDPETGSQVYVGFTPPSGTSLHTSNLGKLVYRARPRYNSEYLYNIPALTGIGAYPPGNNYHTLETWFSKP